MKVVDETIAIVVLAVAGHFARVGPRDLQESGISGGEALVHHPDPHWFDPRDAVRDLVPAGVLGGLEWVAESPLNRQQSRSLWGVDVAMVIRYLPGHARIHLRIWKQRCRIGGALERFRTCWFAHPARPGERRSRRQRQAHVAFGPMAISLYVHDHSVRVVGSGAERRARRDLERLAAGGVQLGPSGDDLLICLGWQLRRRAGFDLQLIGRAFLRLKKVQEPL